MNRNPVSIAYRIASVRALLLRLATPRQRAFADAYAKSGNLKRAAMKAGYAETTADRKGKELLERPAVAAYLKELADATKDETVADLAELRQTWTEILRGRKAGFDSKDQLKASELLGKSLGAFIDRQEVDVRPCIINLDLGGKRK